MKNYGNGFCLLQLIDRRAFEQLCKKWKVDHYVRRFFAWNQLSVLVLSYVMRVDTSREVELVFKVPKSTFCDANQNRPAEFFAELTQLILWKIHDQINARKIKSAIRTVLALDSTECEVHGLLSRFPAWRQKKNSKKSSVKLHCIWDVNEEWIEDFRITPGNTHDSPTAMLFKPKKSNTYVFDRAYNDLKFWQKIMAAEAHFVTRLKKSSWRRFKYLDVLKGREGAVGVLWDGIWKPSETVRIRSRVPKDFSLRYVIYRDPEKKRVFHFVTSDFAAPAEEIAQIYKKRWSVELLFRWLKEHLDIRYFGARSQNSIRTQVAMAVIVQLLVQLYRLKNCLDGTLWDALRRIRTQIWEQGLINLASPGGFPPTGPPEGLSS